MRYFSFRLNIYIFVFVFSVSFFTNFNTKYNCYASEKRPSLKGVVYVLANIPGENANSVLAYRNDGNGNLTQIPGSPFLTGGKGVSTVIPRRKLPHFGPLDLDQPLISNSDHTLLFAVNAGSDTIAVFKINSDGSLTAVEGSPFPSGGKNPVSLGLAGDKIYVVNKNEDPARKLINTFPNYTGFKLSSNGKLTPIPNSTISLSPPTRSPTQALIVEDKFIVDGDFGRLPLTPRARMWGWMLYDDTPSVIRVLGIKKDGTLKIIQELQAPEGEFEGGLDTSPKGEGITDPLMFGLQVHPKEKIIYISFVTNAKMGVYSYNDKGELKFLRSARNKGSLICWIIVNKEGTRAYTTNNGDDSVSVYDLKDPTTPVEIEWRMLKGDGHPYQLALDSEEKFLYIVKHRTFPETPIGEGSILNVLKVNKDGTVNELKSSPLKLPVPAEPFARPMGVVAF